MKNKICAYFIDEMLSEAEEKSVILQLRALGEDESIVLEYRRIPYTFPGREGAVSNVDLMDAFTEHLRHAAIDNSHHSLFIMPQAEIGGTLLLRTAFKSVVGHFPYVVQPWLKEKGREPVRFKWMRVTSMNGFVARNPKDRRSANYLQPPYDIAEGVVLDDRRVLSDRRTAHHESIGQGMIAKIAPHDD